jgi:hypothetical protein
MYIAYLMNFAWRFNEDFKLSIYSDTGVGGKKVGVEGFQQKVIQVIQEPASDGDTQNGSSGACVPNLASEIE